MEEPIDVSRESFERYLKNTFRKPTAEQYRAIFEKEVMHNESLLSQESVEDFVSTKRNQSTDRLNPLYSGFLKAYIECFSLPFRIPKKRMKGGETSTKKQHKFLTKDQVDALIKQSPQWVSLLVQIYFETGLRLRELININQDQLDMVDRTISGVGKNNKPFKVRFTENSAKRLQTWLTKHKYEYPLHSDSTEKEWAKSFYYHLRKASLSILGFKVHPHQIRHALGHYLRLDKGYDLQQIKLKLRHSKLETTDIYTEATQEEIDKIDREAFQ